MTTIDVQALIQGVRDVWDLAVPPAKDVLIWQEGKRAIAIEASWGPPIPYPAVFRSASQSNHGYRPVKGNPVAIDQIPEVDGWPEYANFLKIVNASESPVESVGCAVGLFDADEIAAGAKRAGSYVDLVFSDARRREEIAPHMELAAHLAQALEGCERWWTSIEIALQRLKAMPGSTRPLGLMVRVSSAGRNEDEARRIFGGALEKLGAAFSEVLVVPKCGSNIHEHED